MKRRLALLALLLGVLVGARPAAGHPGVVSGETQDPHWVHTDRNRYEPGQEAEIRFTNPTDETVLLEARPPWWIEDAGGAMRVYTPDRLQEMEPVEPGESRSWSYGLQGEDGCDLPPGRYRAVVGVWVSHHGEAEYRQPYTFFSFRSGADDPGGIADHAVQSARC
jgi:hypothetical protein